MTNIKVFVLVFISIFASTWQVSAQEETPLNTEFISQYVQHFTIEDNILKGKGADFVQNKIQQSQFFVLGEYHGSSQIWKFVEAIAPVMQQSNYSTSVFEIGNYSAKKLTELTELSGNLTQNLKAFNQQYHHKSEPASIPFFENVESAEALKTIVGANMQIWGVDYEYFTSILFLGEEMLLSAKGREDYKELEKAWIDAEKQIRTIIFEVMNNFNKEGVMPFKAIQNDEKFKHFLSFFTEKDLKAKNILKSLKDSWTVYDSRDGRIRRKFIRNNFLEKYKNEVLNNPDAKYFIKFGSAHCFNKNKVIDPNYYDIGALTDSLATLNNTKSTNLLFQRRFMDKDDLIKAKGYYKKAEKLFIQFGRKDKWTIIDIEKIRQAIDNKQVTLSNIKKNKGLKEIIFNMYAFDVFVIPPMDKYVTDNF